MIHYKDRTYCPFYMTCIEGRDCSGALTAEVKAKADKWWGKGKDQAPICAYIEEPECYVERLDYNN